jgi:hypothetical protein
MYEHDLFYAGNVERNLRVGVNAGAISISSIYILVFVNCFCVHVIIVVSTSIIGLIPVGTSPAATPTSVASRISSTTCTIAIAIVVFLVERHPTVLIVGTVGLVRIHKVD